MSWPSKKSWIRTAGLIGLGVLIGLAVVEVTGYRSRGNARRRVSLLNRLLGRITQFITKFVPWYRLPRPLGVMSLVGIRATLRQKNLHDTDVLPSVEQPAPRPNDHRYLTARTADGTYNDLEQPRMGAAHTRFGRNFPFDHSHAESEPDLLIPNPRTVSRELLAR